MKTSLKGADGLRGEGHETKTPSQTVQTKTVDGVSACVRAERRSFGRVPLRAMPPAFPFSSSLADALTSSTPGQTLTEDPWSNPECFTYSFRSWPPQTFVVPS